MLENFVKWFYSIKLYLLIYICHLISIGIFTVRLTGKYQILGLWPRVKVAFGKKAYTIMPKCN